MKIDRDRLFAELEPPPGGMEKLRARFARTSYTPARGWRLAAAGGAVALFVFVLVQVQRDSPPHGSRESLASAPIDLHAAPELNRLLGRQSPPLELSVIADGEQARVTALRTSDPRIRLYRLE